MEQLTNVESGSRRFRAGVIPGLQLMLGVLILGKLVVSLAGWQTRPAVAAAPEMKADAGAVEALAQKWGGSVEGFEAIVREFAEREEALDAREEELARRADELALYEKDVSRKISELQALGARLEERLESAVAADEAAVVSLAKVYSAMKPGEAAPILDKLDQGTVLEILRRMRAKQVGEILPLMERERAIVLTRSLARGRE